MQSCLINDKSKSRTIIILSATDTLVPRINLEKETLEKAGFTVDVIYRKRIFWNLKTFFFLPFYYVRVIRKCLSKNIGAVHLSHILQIPLSPILKIGRKLIIYDAYDRYSIDISEQHFRGLTQKPARYVIEFFENLIIKGFIDAVFVVSTRHEFLFKRYRKYCELTECLYNVPSVKHMFRGDLQTKYRGRTLKIAYVGGISYQKGAQYFVPLANVLREREINFEFHLIGTFSSKDEKESLLKDIQYFNLMDYMFFHGFMDYMDMIRFLQKCHIGLSLYDNSKRLSVTGIGTSRKTFTYMSAGMVVITSDVGQMSFVVKRDNCGVVLKHSDNLDVLACIIENFAKDRSKAIALAKNGIDSIKKQYNWEMEKYKLLSVYDELFSVPNRGIKGLDKM